MDFQVNGKSLDKALGTGASEILQDVVLHKSRIFVVERNQFSALAQEHQLQYSGLTDDNTAIAIGKITGAEYVVLGSINAMGNTIVLAARIVNVEQALVLHSFRIPSQNGINGLYTTLENLGNRVATVLAETKIAPLRQQPTPFPEKAPLSRVTPTPKPQARKIPPSSSASPTPLPINPKELFSEGLQAFEQGNQKQAIGHWQKAAQAGHPEAMARLGECYYYGWGISENQGKAFSLLKNAASEESVYAQALLYSIDPAKFASYRKAYLETSSQNETSQNPLPQQQKPSPTPKVTSSSPSPIPTKPPLLPETTSSAKASEKDVPQKPEDMHSLGTDYQYGRNGKSQDLSQALQWYRKAASLGYPPARDSLGILYEKGIGVPQHYGEAISWYRKAANAGLPAGEYHLASLYERGLGVTRNEKEALGWYEKAAQKGHLQAQHALGKMFEEGRGTGVNYEKAAYWYRKSAEGGYPNAQYALGMLYGMRQGVGTLSVKEYNEQSALWFGKAARAGYILAQYYFAFLCHEGFGVPQSFEKAAYWYTKAAEGGHDIAQLNLGFMYREGRGVPQDYAKAAYWLEKAAKKGHSFAQYHIGLMYRDGQGVRQSRKKAVFWLRKAAENGHDGAKCELKRLGLK